MIGRERSGCFRKAQKARRGASSRKLDILLHNPTMKRHVLIFGLVGGLLIAILKYTEYRFVVIEHSVELYSALVAILFAAFGIWLGLRITRRREIIRETVVVREVVVPAGAPPERSGAESKACPELVEGD